MLHGPKKADPARSVFFVPPCLPLDTIPPCSSPPVVPQTPCGNNMLGLLLQTYPLCSALQAGNAPVTVSRNSDNATTRERDEAMSPCWHIYENAITRQRMGSLATVRGESLTREREQPRTRERDDVRTRQSDIAIMAARPLFGTRRRHAIVTPRTRYRKLACFLERELARTRHRENGTRHSGIAHHVQKTRQRLNATFRERDDATSR